MYKRQSESSDKIPAEAPQTAHAGEVVYLSEPLDRPAALEGQTYKVKWPGSEHALYITCLLYTSRCV